MRSRSAPQFSGRVSNRTERADRSRPSFSLARVFGSGALVFAAAALVGAGAGGCSKSSSPGPAVLDGGVDAAADGDTTTDGATTDAGVPVCGNMILDGNDACDDGNSVDGDACRNDCTLPPICGDGTEDPGEQCDDGDNHSGDGCSGTCKDEICGNAVLDPGEVCDGTPGCAVTCDAITGCGNGTVAAPEQCDDGNTNSWDGCSSGCQVEQATVLSEIQILTSGGCDLTGDGLPDALLGANLETVLPTLAPLINDAIAQAPFNVLTVLGLEDPSLVANDPSVRVAWVSGNDANGMAPDLDGTGSVTIAAASIPLGEPQLAFPGSITGGLLDAGPEDITIPFFQGYELGIRRARIAATPLTVTSGTPPRVSVAGLAGTLCGVAAVAPFAGLPNVLGALGGGFVPTNSCDAATVPTNQITMADVLVGGASAASGFITLIGGVQPDIDMDGDGLEQYVLSGDGTNCQRVIVSCVDGDGTAIAGHACVGDARMQDGWSAAFHFSAPITHIVP